MQSNAQRSNANTSHGGLWSSADSSLTTVNQSGFQSGKGFNANDPQRSAFQNQNQMQEDAARSVKMQSGNFQSGQMANN